jgi:hypothetical protein
MIKSHERSGLRISGMAFTIKVIYRRFSVPGKSIKSQQNLRMAKSRKTTYRDCQIPEDDLPKLMKPATKS